MDIAFLFDKLKKHGVLGLLEIGYKNIQHHWRMWLDDRLDKRFGLDTAGYTSLDHLDVDSANKQWGVRYEPSSYNQLRAAFSCLPSDLSQYTFVDYGSGRGRVVAVASQYGFKQIIGVEFSKELHEASIRNVSRLPRAKQRCADVRLVHQDATLFRIPTGPLVLYFFDPFRDVVMSKVLDNIRQSYLAERRKIYVMYLAPYHEDMFANSDIFVRVKTDPFPFDPTLHFQFKFMLFETLVESVT